MNKFKPISISLSPNVEKDDVHLAFKLLFMPWLWKNPPSRKASAGKGGNAIAELAEQFRGYLGVKYAVSFNSGRSSLFAILKAMGASKGDKILLQAFTCNASINPALWTELTPIYVDCNENTFNIDVADLKQKISQNSNAKFLMVQHTFGLPADMDEIFKICKENNLILIEDCAHALGAEYNNKKIGTFGEVSFFSFSRDKIISSVYGGIAVTNNQKIGEKLKEMQKEFGYPSLFWTKQQIIHPLVLKFLILPIYNFLEIGKIFLVLTQWFYILSKAVHWKEKRGLKPNYFPKALPNALAIMALLQFKRLDKFYNHRKKIFDYYLEKLKDTAFLLPQIDKNYKQSCLRFTVKHPKAHEIIYKAWHKENILLGDWYTTPIAPFDTNLEQMHYKIEMCPTAEWLSKRTLNLPTHINISDKDAEQIVNFLKKYF
jgi:dTDP-4-amino-4,6-dideoxygalactose transaminase